MLLCPVVAWSVGSRSARLHLVHLLPLPLIRPPSFCWPVQPPLPAAICRESAPCVWATQAHPQRHQPWLKVTAKQVGDPSLKHKLVMRKARRRHSDKCDAAPLAHPDWVAHCSPRNDGQAGSSHTARAPCAHRVGYLNLNNFSRKWSTFEALVNAVPWWGLLGEELRQGVRAPLGELPCKQCSNS